MLKKDYEKLPGLTAVITDKDENKWAGSFGLSDGENKMNIENTFEVFAQFQNYSLALMQLVEEGKISLDDPIKDVLPWFDINNDFDNAPDATLKSILSHSSGLHGSPIIHIGHGQTFLFHSNKM